MNKQEAINILAGLYRIPVENGADKFASEINKAIDMAIEALQDDWIPVSERLPEPCADVQVTCEVRYSDGMKRKYQSIAQWIPKNCEEALGINWDVEATEYNEEKDEYYPLEGWYESIKNWDEFSLVAISDFVIAWQPLPEIYRSEGENK